MTDLHPLFILKVLCCVLMNTFSRVNLNQWIPILRNSPSNRMWCLSTIERSPGLPENCLCKQEKNPMEVLMVTPILNRRFFQDHPPSPAIYQKWREFYEWTDQILPVYEWQDVVYVGCLALPKEFPLGPKKSCSVFAIWNHFLSLGSDSTG